MAATDTDAAQDIYERTSGGFRHISDDPTGPDAGLAAEFRGASGGGVRFRTSEPMASSDTDGNADVYELDPAGGLTHLTRDPFGPEDALDADVVGTSGDGTRLYLETTERLAPTDLDQSIDVFERLADGSLRHVSDDPAGPDDAINARFDAASKDGGRVLFTTGERLAAGDTDTEPDVYERAPSGALVAVSDGAVDGLYAQFAAASSDGTRVYFNSSDQLDPGDTDGYLDVYVSTVVPDPPTPPAPPAGGASSDTTAPRITRVRVVRGRLRFTLSEPARVRVALRSVAAAGRGR